MATDWIKKRIGTDIEWRLFPTGPEMIKAFDKAELDVGYIGLPPAMIGIGKGLAIKCIAGGHMEGTVFTARSDFKTLKEMGTEKETLRQFKGTTIGTPSRGSIHDVILRSMLDKHGLQKDITVKNFQWADEIIEALEDGAVAGGVGTPALAVLAARLLDAKVVLPSYVMWPHNSSYGIIATVGNIMSYPNTLKGFLEVHEEACNFIRKHPEEAAEIAAKVLGMVDKSFVLEVYRISPKYCASLSREYIDSTLDFMPLLQKTGYISKLLNQSEIFYEDLIKRIHPEKPHYDDPDMLA